MAVTRMQSQKQRRYKQTHCNHKSMTQRSVKIKTRGNSRKYHQRANCKRLRTGRISFEGYILTQPRRKMKKAKTPETVGLVKRGKVQCKQTPKLKGRPSQENSEERNMKLSSESNILMGTLQKFRIEQKKKKESRKLIPDVTLQSDFTTWKKRLLSAIKHGDIKSVQKGLKENCDYGLRCQPIYDEALVEASQHGHKRIVKLLLDSGASVKYKNSRSSTALLVAVEYGFFDIVKMLLVYGAEVNIVQRNGDSPLMLAIEKAHSKQMAFLLIDAGANVNCQNRHGRTPAMICVEKQDFDTLWFLAASGADLNMTDSGDNTALTLAADEIVAELVQLISQSKGRGQDKLMFRAIEKNCFELLQIVLDCDFIDIKAIENNQSALIAALLRGSCDGRDWNNSEMINPAIVELLITKGSDVNQQANSHFPLCLAAASGRTDLVSLFLASGANVDVEDLNKMTPLMYAAAKGYPAVINKLVQHHVNINYVNQMEYSALTYALAEGNVQSATVLLQNGSTVNKMHDTIVTIKRQQDASLKLILTYVDISEIPSHVLFLAVQDSNYNAAEYLIERGMEINIKQFNGETLLMEATTLPMIKMLIQKGADVNLCGQDLIHPLMHFSTQNCFKQREDVREAIVDTLLKNGADPNRSDSHGSTALMKAVHYQREQIALLLLEGGAEVNKANSAGQTALMIAAQQEGSESLVEMLLDKGAIVNLQDNSGRNTALMYAAMNSMKKTVEILLDNGADVDVEDKKGHTALLFTSDSDIASLLCAKGSDVNKANLDGKTALMSAAQWRRLPLLTLLIRQGADVCAVDSVNSATALTLIMQSEHLNDVDYPLIKVLLEAGAATVCYQHCDITLTKLIVDNQKELVRLYVTKGAGPSGVCTTCLKHQKCFAQDFCDRIPLPTLSALDVSLICGNIQLAKYLNNNLYLRWSDIFRSSRSRTCFVHLLRDLGCQESLEFLENFYHKPRTLYELSFISVSDLLGPFCRKNKVQQCELPQNLTDLLLFRDSDKEIPFHTYHRLKENVERLCPKKEMDTNLSVD